MNKQQIFSTLSALITSSLVSAGGMGSLETLKPLIALQGGYASIVATKGTQQFLGTDSDVFTYWGAGKAKNKGFIGAFVGVQQALPPVLSSNYFIHTGIEYNYYGSVNAQGNHSVGIEPGTSTLYNYNYNFQTQQVLGTVKLFATTSERFHPYGEFGLGAAFNKTSQYHVTTLETGSINLSPVFRNQNQSQFSYILGLGIDVQVIEHFRANLGYRYSNFGSASLGHGAVIFNDYQAPVSFALGSSNVYANQLIAGITYIV